MLKSATSNLFAACIFSSFGVFAFTALCETDRVVAQSSPSQNSISISDLESEVKQAAKSQNKEESIIIDELNSAMRATRFGKSSFPYYEPPDGCSAPDTWKFKKWNAVFESACNSHDICYVIPGNRKESCDHQMLRDMLKICANTFDLSSQAACKNAAEGYYDGIDTLASRAYNIAQSRQRQYIDFAYAWLTQRWPGKYIGTWKGSGVQAGGGWSIAITLKAGDQDSVVGTIDYPSIPCGGELTLRRITRQSIRLSENLTNLGTCVNGGTVILQLDGSDQLQYKWYYSNGSLAATGSLQREK